jgi:hypothetical protein
MDGTATTAELLVDEVVPGCGRHSGSQRRRRPVRLGPGRRRYRTQRRPADRAWPRRPTRLTNSRCAQVAAWRAFTDIWIRCSRIPVNPTVSSEASGGGISRWLSRIPVRAAALAGRREGHQPARDRSAEGRTSGGAPTCARSFCGGPDVGQEHQRMGTRVTSGFVPAVWWWSHRLAYPRPSSGLGTGRSDLVPSPDGSSQVKRLRDCLRSNPRKAGVPYRRGLAGPFRLCGVRHYPLLQPGRSRHLAV